MVLLSRHAGTACHTGVAAFISSCACVFLAMGASAGEASQGSSHELAIAIKRLTSATGGEGEGSLTVVLQAFRNRGLPQAYRRLALEGVVAHLLRHDSEKCLKVLLSLARDEANGRKFRTGVLRTLQLLDLNWGRADNFNSNTVGQLLVRLPGARLPGLKRSTTTEAEVERGFQQALANHRPRCRGTATNYACGASRRTPKTLG